MGCPTLFPTSISKAVGYTAAEDTGVEEKPLIEFGTELKNENIPVEKRIARTSITTAIAHQSVVRNSKDA
ncbi:hypothetical protein IHI25_01560 [Candidatus Parvarchaeota archaeon]|nr:hypothetical protein [Candidatus Acidifodinimicrobium mancum]